MNHDFDIAVFGGGFGGSILAAALRKQGRSVLLIEKGRHPRFAIGESSTPLANLLLEEIAVQFDLPELLPLTQWGTWQEKHPRMGCGLKRGFSFYHHTPGKVFDPGPDRANELLVAASPCDAVADTHWYRPDFDRFLAELAVSLGVEYLDMCEILSIDREGAGFRVEGRAGGGGVGFRAGFLVDATGPRGLLSRLFGIVEGPLHHMPRTAAAFAHFSGVERFAPLFPPDPVPPYPPDDAAVHHLFPGGWIWVLRFNNGLTSAGAVWDEAAAARLDLGQGQAAWKKLLLKLPSVADCFANARIETRFYASQALPYLAGRTAGPGWALLPSTAGFIDPLLSTGFPMNLWGILRLARLLGTDSAGCGEADLAGYERDTMADVRVAERLIAALYSVTDAFEIFKPLSLLYFGAVSFAESAWRLGVPERARTFLLRDDPIFHNAMVRLCDIVSAGAGAFQRPLKPALAREILETLEPYDVAGLGKARTRPWYPADPGDLIASSSKLGVAPEAVRDFLRRLGLAA